MVKCVFISPSFFSFFLSVSMSVMRHISFTYFVILLHVFGSILLS